MERRLFLQSVLGTLVAPLTGPLLAKIGTSETILVPAQKDLISRFGFVTDIHYGINRIRIIPAEDSIRVNNETLIKLCQATDLFNVSNVDFMIELGDFKDCNDDGDRKETLRYLQTVEKEFSRFNGPRYHVAGNHDFDKISYEDFVSNIVNHGEANGKLYYSFISGGVKYIVLDACYNNEQGEHYSMGKFNWKVALIPNEELAWLKKELSSGTEPIIVFTHQLLNYWDENPIPRAFFMRNAKTVVEMLENSGRVLAVLSGHYHKGYYSERKGIHYVVNKAMVKRPLPQNAFGIVSVDKDLNMYVEGIYNERSRICKHKV